MNKFVAKNILLFASSLLLFGALALTYLTKPPDDLFLKRAWGGCGPCWNINNDCGGYGGGTGTCDFDYDLGYCTGQCIARCPSGPADQSCLTLYNRNCRVQASSCSQKVTYSCETGAYDPPHCVCEETGIGDCPGQECSSS